METPSVDKYIEKYIKRITAEKRALLLPQFILDNVKFIIDHTLDHQWNMMERVWGSRVGKVAKRLNVIMHVPRESDALTAQKVLMALSKKSGSPTNLASVTNSALSSSAVSKDNSHLLTAEMRAEFQRAYRTMNNEDKWQVKPGVYVEDVMYDFGVKATHEHPVHSFILNVCDPCWEAVFDQVALHKIRTHGNYSLPSLDSQIQDLLNAYNDQPDDDVLDFLIQKSQDLGTFDIRANEDLYKLHHIIQQFLGFYYDNVFDNVESWTEDDFISYVWSPLNRLFQSRLVNTRSQTSVMGPKRVGNGRNSCLEYGCSESSTSLSAISDQEILERQLHREKKMKDMLRYAIEEAKHDPEVMRKLKTVSFDQTGLSMSLSIMDSPAGYICRVAESEKYKVPVHADFMVSELFPVLKLALQAKVIVQNSLSLIKRRRLVREETRLSFERAPPKVLLPPCLAASLLPSSRKRSQHSQTEPTRSKKKKSKTSSSSSSSPSSSTSTITSTNSAS